MDAQEPLPYVQPQPGARHIPATPAALDMDEDDERIRAASRRGTQNFGLLILRVGLGAVLIAHGLQKLFGWWGGSGVTAFKNSLSDVGFQHADILAYVAPAARSSWECCWFWACSRRWPGRAHWPS